MFDILSDETKSEVHHPRICGKAMPVPVRSGGTVPRLALGQRTPLPGLTTPLRVWRPTSLPGHIDALGVPC
jgi:hypothetical protein